MDDHSFLVSLSTPPLKPNTTITILPIHSHHSLTLHTPLTVPPLPFQLMQDLAKCESEMQAWEMAFQNSEAWFEEYVSAPCLASSPCCLSPISQLLLMLHTKGGLLCAILKLVDRGFVF